MKKSEKLGILGLVLLISGVVLVSPSLVNYFTDQERDTGQAEDVFLGGIVLLVAGSSLMPLASEASGQEKMIEDAQKLRQQFMATFGVPPESLSTESIARVRQRLDELRASLRQAMDELASISAKDQAEAVQTYINERSSQLGEAVNLALKFHVGV